METKKLLVFRTLSFSHMLHRFVVSRFSRLINETDESIINPYDLNILTNFLISFRNLLYY